MVGNNTEPEHLSCCIAAVAGNGQDTWGLLLLVVFKRDATFDKTLRAAARFCTAGVSPTQHLARVVLLD